jgi:Cu(I)/Ag(I) efflux system membrane fusion protein
MSAQVSLMSRVQGTALAVPTEAVIRTGKRSLVMLANGAGRFSAQEIQIAHEVGDQTLVSAGLEEGQQVVVSGQFLIDSEASLNSLEAHSLPKPEQFGTQVAP